MESISSGNILDVILCDTKEMSDTIFEALIAQGHLVLVASKTIPFPDGDVTKIELTVLERSKRPLPSIVTSWEDLKDCESFEYVMKVDAEKESAYIFHKDDLETIVAFLSSHSLTSKYVQSTEQILNDHGFNATLVII